MTEQPVQQPVETAGNQPVATKKKRSPMARFLRWVCFLLLSPVILFLILTILLYIPFVQDWAVGIACDKISEATQLDVKVDRLRLSFPLDVDLQGLCITNNGRFSCDSKVRPDTVLAVNHCLVDLDICGLLGGSVAVDAFDLEGVVTDTHQLIPSLVVKGNLNKFHLDVHDLEFENRHVQLTGAALEGCDLDIALRDTTIIDTTTSKPTKWYLDFSDIELKDTRLAFHTRKDTMSVRTGVKQMSLTRGKLDLARGTLHLDDLKLEADSVLYDMNYLPRQEGLDYNHIRLYDIHTDLEKADYDLKTSKLCAVLPMLTLREKSGLQIDELALDACMDTLGVHIDHASLKTPSSDLRAEADIEWSALKPDGDGTLTAKLSADLSREDVLLLAGPYLPANLRSQLPHERMTAEVDVTGNVRHIGVNALRVKMPGMLDAQVSGASVHLLEDGKLAADLNWDIKTQDLSLIKKITGLTGVKLPPMTLTGTTRIADNLYQAKLLLKQGNGSLLVDGSYSPKGDTYKALLKANNFTVTNFVPLQETLVLTATAQVSGKGYDIFSPRTQLKALVDVPRARYGKSELSHVHLDTKLAQGSCWTNFYSGGDLVDGDGCIELKLNKNRIDSAAFTVDLHALDLYAMGITKRPFKTSMSMHMQGNTNLSDSHYLKGDVSAMKLTLKDTTFYPRDITLETYLNPDTTFAQLSAGDLKFRLNSTDGLSALMQRGIVFADSVNHQMGRKQYDQDVLNQLLPTVDLCIQSGDKNPLNNILRSMVGYSYRELDVDIHTDPLTGIKADGHIFSVNTGAIVLDSIYFDLNQDDGRTKLDARICNGKKNKDVTFDARLNAGLRPGMVDWSLLYYDSHHTKAVDLGGELEFHNGERRLHLTPLRPVLANRYFTLNEDNYLLLHRDGRIEANMDMVADDGTGLKLYSLPNEDAEQDLTASLNHFNLGELCSVIPYMPSINGLLNGDLHYQQQGGITSVMTDLTAHDFVYEGTRMGTIGVNAAYMPNEDGSHFVDGILLHEGNEVLSYNGRYATTDNGDDIDANVSLQDFPLTLLNGFLDETTQLSGCLLGDLQVTGSSARPIVDGALQTKSMHILSPLYSIDLRFNDEDMRVVGSCLNLSDIQVRSTGKNPLTLDGMVNFANLSNVFLDVRAKAKNFELINAQKNRKAAAYGKVYVDLDARAKGSTQNLSLTGRLAILGNTNVTYVLMDSPITVEDQMSDLVTFCDFNDTVEVEEPVVVPPSNLKMQMQISIDQRSNVNCLLSQDGSNYIKLEGGGDLNMSYSGVRGLQMTGRYTILQGKMTYTMMVVSVKDCEIENGSYVEFTGDISNPRLKIDAVECVKSNITENDTPRNVSFDVGLSITQTLSNMGLAFTLDAPEDMYVQNEIAQMSEEQRSRVAVTLLATGMYLVEGQQTSSLNTTNALNSFLQSQISSITGKALSTFDISLGVQNNSTQSGATKTDYSFSFAKRFWGNRISLVVGGKVSSGSEAENTGQSIIDNVSIEYRLDKSATRYVTLFYDNSNESVLEGKVTQMGAALVLRRKTNNLGELFLFRNSKKEEEQAKEMEEMMDE